MSQSNSSRRKIHDKQFNFVDSSINNLAYKPQGPVNISNHKEIFESGATKQSIDISDGNFPQANIGGTANYNNKKSSVTAGDSYGTGDWSYDVDAAVLQILKAGISTDQILQAILKGKKLKSLYDYVCKCEEQSFDVMFDSFLHAADDDEEEDCDDNKKETL